MLCFTEIYIYIYFSFVFVFFYFFIFVGFFFGRIFFNPVWRMCVVDSIPLRVVSYSVFKKKSVSREIEGGRVLVLLVLMLLLWLVVVVVVFVAAVVWFVGSCRWCCCCAAVFLYSYNSLPTCSCCSPIDHISPSDSLCTHQSLNKSQVLVPPPPLSMFPFCFYSIL